MAAQAQHQDHVVGRVPQVVHDQHAAGHRLFGHGSLGRSMVALGALRDFPEQPRELVEAEPPDLGRQVGVPLTEPADEVSLE